MRSGDTTEVKIDGPATGNRPPQGLPGGLNPGKASSDLTR